MTKHVHSTLGSGSSAGSSSSKISKSVVDPKWSDTFLWMLEVYDGCGLMCSSCRKHSRHPQKVGIGKAVWVDVACTNLIRLRNTV